MTNKEVRRPIKRQIAFIFMALMAGTIVLCWFINSTFLENFYIKYRTAAIERAYESVNTAANNGDITSEDFDLELRKICDMNNISMVVIDAESNTIKSSSRDPDVLVRHLYDNFFMPNNLRKYLKEDDYWEM